MYKPFKSASLAFPIRNFMSKFGVPSASAPVSSTNLKCSSPTEFWCRKFWSHMKKSFIIQKSLALAYFHGLAFHKMYLWKLDECSFKFKKAFFLFQISWVFKMQVAFKYSKGYLYYVWFCQKKKKKMEFSPFFPRNVLLKCYMKHIYLKCCCAF